MKNTTTEQMDPELQKLTNGWNRREVRALGAFFGRMAAYQNRMADWIENGGRKPAAPRIIPRRRQAAILMTMLRTELCPHN